MKRLRSSASISDSLIKILRSDTFFYITVILFIFAAIWISVSSLYPMAFDEEFHFGLIQIYASSWLPFGIEHTSDMAQYGAATGDPSYLFHYLMSFPYRILDFFGMPTMAIIIVLRMINIALVVAGLFVFRKVLATAGFGKAVSNITLTLVMLVPVFSLLAAQINYDNLLFPIVATAVLLTHQLSRMILWRKQPDIFKLILLCIVILIGISVKYAFLPIAAVCVLWLLISFVYIHRLRMREYTKVFRSFITDIRKFSFKRSAMVLALGFLSLFFVSHYVSNYVQYGHPIPSCERVFTEDECTAYGPWNRNKLLESQRSDSFEPDSLPKYLAVHWLPGITDRLTFAVAGKTNDFDTKRPQILLLVSFVTLTIVGTISFIAYVLIRRFHINPFIWYVVLLTFVYVGALVYQIYGDYVRTGQPVAINGRYLLPLLPLIGAVLVYATNCVTKIIPVSYKAVGVLLVILLLVVGGGGIGTYIVQADSDWFWPGLGQASHDVLRKIFETFVISKQI